MNNKIQSENELMLELKKAGKIGVSYQYIASTLDAYILQKENDGEFTRVGNRLYLSEYIEQ